MSAPLHLVISTPDAVLVDDAAVRAVRAEDASGGFGILPGHTDLLTVLPASVVRWRGDDGQTRYCAVHGGVLRVSRGRAVAIACRQGTLGDDLAALEAEVREAGRAQTDAERKARVEQTQLHARVVRQLMRYLRPASGESIQMPPADGGGG